MRYSLIPFRQKIAYHKRLIGVLKIFLNIGIVVSIAYILIKKKVEIYSLINTTFLLLVLYDFLILFLVSLRIFYLSKAINEKISLKTIYFVTITTKFYNIFFPSILTEGIRGLKYFLSGIKNKHSVFFLVVFDRVIGFVTLFIMFLSSVFLLKPLNMDRNVFFFSLAFSLAFLFILFITNKIFVNHKIFNAQFSKRELFTSFGISFIAQMAIMLKYFFIFRLLINIHIDFINTIYISSASHISQIIPISTGLFSIKDGFLFYLITAQQNELTKALGFIFVLSSIEVLLGMAGGVLELINFLNFKKNK